MRNLFGLVRACGGLGGWPSGWYLFASLVSWHLLKAGPRTGSPMTWLSTCRVRLMPTMPKTTKTMAPVSTSGRTAGFPQPAFTQGLKPKVAERRALGPAKRVIAVLEAGSSPPRPHCGFPACTFFTGHIEEAFGRPIGAGTEQAAGRSSTDAPVERWLVGLCKVQFPVEAREARTKAGKTRTSWGGEASVAMCRGWAGAPPAQEFGLWLGGDWCLEASSSPTPAKTTV